MDSVTVITLSRNRPALLKRCITSVQKQDYVGEVQHLVLVDNCWKTASFLKEAYPLTKNLTWVLRGRHPDESSGPSHLARLRNLGIRIAETTWICFLDDDNEYESFHLSKLIECAENSGSLAVHSWIQLFHFDGKPYLKKRWPWSRNDEEGRDRYAMMVKRGVVSPGSNILKDSIHNLPYRCVDTSAWLLKRSLLLEHPISSDFSYEEWVNNKAEDDKLQMQIMRMKTLIHCNEVVSVRYYLGGYSTNYDGSHKHSEIWEWHHSNKQ